MSSQSNWNGFAVTLVVDLSQTLFEVLRAEWIEARVVAISAGSREMRATSEALAATRSPHLWSCRCAIVTITVTWKFDIIIYKTKQNIQSNRHSNIRARWGDNFIDSIMSISSNWCCRNYPSNITKVIRKHNIHQSFTRLNSRSHAYQRTL